MSAFRVASLALLASLSFAAEALAQAGDAIPRDAVRGYEVQRTRRDDVAIDPRQRPPRFIVEAVSFKADDETHYSWQGSDSIYAYFGAATGGMHTRTVDDVDSGDTERFLATQSCIYPAVDPDRRQNGRWSCDPAGAPGPIEFTVMLLEDDAIALPPFGFSVCNNPPSAVGTDLNACPDSEADDRVLNATVRMDVSEILSRLNPSCRCVTRTLTSSNSDSTYQFTFRITMVDAGGGLTLEQGPAPSPGPVTPPVLRSGSLTAQQDQRFEFDAGTVVGNGGDFRFRPDGNQYVLAPLSGARIWVGNATARGYAGCVAGAANHVTTIVPVPANGSYACYITSDGHVGELQITALTTSPLGPARLALSYTTWQ